VATLLPFACIAVPRHKAVRAFDFSPNRLDTPVLAGILCPPSTRAAHRRIQTSKWEDLMSKLFQLAAGTIIAVGMSFGAQAADTMMKYTANLTAAEEVPPNTSTGKGKADLTLNTATKELSWNVTWEGLTGDAVAAHIHGPADKGANAGVMVQLGVQGTPPKSPLTGKMVLTDAQIADLNAGKAYVNVHTPMNKGGEIRGQVTK
jgi:hypothetical protein